MNIIHIIHICFALLCIVEAKLESYVQWFRIRMAVSAEWDRKNAAEHTWSAIYYCMIVGIIVLLSSYIDIDMEQRRWLMILSLLCVRRLFFQEAFNLFAQKGLFYLSDRGIDGVIKRMLGNRAGVWQMIVCITMIFFCNTKF